MKKHITALLLTLCVLISCSCEKEEQAPSVDKRGSARVLDGNIIVVSIFADDHLCAWDFESDEDIATRDETLENLTFALDFLSEQSKKWGKNAEFIYDWKENPDLSYQRGVPLRASTFEFKTSNYFNKIVNITIDSDLLLEKYDAQNILYIYFFNTDFTNESTAQAFPYFPKESGYYNETIGLPLKNNGQSISATVYAHEILHLFGAPDYYKGNSTFGVTDEYIEYCQKNHPKELMLTTKDENKKYVHGEVTAEINEITAYYVGWTDYSKEVEEFGLPQSTHITTVEE